MLDVNILFIGGSNLVIRDGLSEMIPKSLMSSGVDVKNVYNIAVGATTCLFGLENTHLFGKKNIDVIFIEYGINDLPLFSNDRKLWEYSFSALLECVRNKYPKALVVTILLGRRKERFWKNQSLMHDKMKLLTSKYGGLSVDVDSMLKSKAGIVAAFDDFYLDDSHYSSPSVTSYISQQVVSEMLLAQSVNFFSDSINVAIDPLPRLDISSISGEIKCFENTRFMQKTSILNKNDSTVVRVRGIPVGVSFISEYESCSLLIEVDGYKKIINTKRKKSSLGRFSFILKHIPLYGFLSKDLEINRCYEVKLSAVDINSPDWDDSIIQSTYGMEPADHSTSGKVFLSHITSCSGTRINK
ncbi:MULTISPECIES: SGNH/GDSL hydrolase family protein [Nitrincola]|uniref:Uncharacterized protein n=1 Tax=Nitrincola nitratireducens TaxID=1229521 RepID=W9V3B0_9GAMM|nr:MULTISPECIES: SGNH/GDSL hydrolase family protein [Nitrincola]EXJ10642.1 hypothetical protein D791_02473 [Nitrincola nitratireducens]